MRHRVNAAIKAVVMSRILCVVAAVLLVSSCHFSAECVLVKLPVQLAISEESFLSFGTIYGDVEEHVSTQMTFPHAQLLFAWSHVLRLAHKSFCEYVLDLRQ